MPVNISFRSHFLLLHVQSPLKVNIDNGLRDIENPDG